jgi:hypothetical protein
MRLPRRRLWRVYRLSRRAVGRQNALSQPHVLHDAYRQRARETRRDRRRR